jgi:hypothetical protein
MNRNRGVAVLLTAVSLLTACNLDEEIVSGVTTSYFESAEGLEDAVRAAYSRVLDMYGQEENMMMLQAGTDTWSQSADGSDKFFDSYDPGLNAGTRWVRAIWTNGYRAINTTNAVIDRAENIHEGISEAQKTERVAEVRFLRAFYYFYLVRQYGDLYLTLHETQGAVTEAHRTPVAEIYEKAIIPDLEFAVANLPLTPSNGEKGRATKGAAQHLLSLVYLTRAAPGDMARSAELAKAVINSGQYGLLPRYEDLFKLENEQSEEVIFSLQATADPLSWGRGNSWGFYTGTMYEEMPGMVRSIEYGKPHKRLRPTDYLLHVHNRAIDTRYEGGFRTVWFVNKPDPAKGLELGDTSLFMPGVKTSELPDVYKNKEYAVVTEPDDYAHPVANPLPDAPNVRSEYDLRYFPMLTKHLDPTRTTVNQRETQKDLAIYRLADTYLMAAEALYRDGKAEEAVGYINTVRRRAARPGMEKAMEITAADLSMDFILDERARELYCEGHRWFDLVRTGTLVDRVRKYNLFGAPNIQPYHALRPIPSDQIDRTKNADGSSFGQNPGY